MPEYGEGQGAFLEMPSVVVWQYWRCLAVTRKHFHKCSCSMGGGLIKGVRTINHQFSCATLCIDVFASVQTPSLHPLHAEKAGSVLLREEDALN